MFPDAPALAADFAFSGPEDNRIGYDLGYGLQASPVEFDPYPQPAADFSSLTSGDAPPAEGVSDLGID